MSKINGNGQDDFVAAGFHRLDERLVTRRPPKIMWGPEYLMKTDSAKIEYLEKLAAAMNHAAHLIQDERDQLNKLCGLKEEQITSMKASLAQNNEMIHSEITKMNEERQSYNAQIAKLNQRIRELEGGYNG